MSWISATCSSDTQGLVRLLNVGHWEVCWGHWIVIWINCSCLKVLMCWRNIRGCFKTMFPRSCVSIILIVSLEMSTSLLIKVWEVSNSWLGCSSGNWISYWKRSVLIPKLICSRHISVFRHWMCKDTWHFCCDRMWPAYFLIQFIVVLSSPSTSDYSAPSQTFTGLLISWSDPVSSRSPSGLAPPTVPAWLTMSYALSSWSSTDPLSSSSPVFWGRWGECLEFSLMFSNILLWLVLWSSTELILS